MSFLYQVHFVYSQHSLVVRVVIGVGRYCGVFCVLQRAVLRGVRIHFGFGAVVVVGGAGATVVVGDGYHGHVRGSVLLLLLSGARAVLAARAVGLYLGQHLQTRRWVVIESSRGK